MERTVTYRYSMLLGLCLAVALGAMSPLRVAGNDAAMLKRIASRVDGRVGVIAIEATTPVPYIASQPDPKTFVVELRDVVAVGFQNDFSADPRNPIAALQVEHAAATDGTIVARVRMTVARKEWLERTTSSRGLALSWTSTERVVEQARLVKDANEVATLRDAAARLTFVADKAFDAVRPGVTERDVAAVLETGLRSAGYERPAFDTIVASGPNAALPHYRAGLRVLKAGDLVVLDFGGVLDGYCSDLTRTVSVGRPTDDALRLHSAVRDAQRRAIEAVKPGVPAASVDAAARSLLESRGLGEAFGHGTGHGLGLDIHEEPRIGPPRSHSASVQLEPGMVFTIEPGAYLPGLGGVRIEDDVLVTADGYEVLTSVTRELLELG